jgi:hypothetical protein
MTRIKDFWWSLRRRAYSRFARWGLRGLDGMYGFIWLVDAMYEAAEDGLERCDDRVAAGEIDKRMLAEYRALWEILGCVHYWHKGDGAADWWRGLKA